MEYSERYAVAVVEEVPLILADNGMIIIIIIGIGGFVGLVILYFGIKALVKFIIKLKEESRNKPTEKKKVSKKSDLDFKIPEFPKGKRELVLPPVAETISV
jgi:hypothetical protein